MKLTDFQAALRHNPEAVVRFKLPDATYVPIHVHVTEVGRVDKRFMDCGGTIRFEQTCRIQLWLADDMEHRLKSKKFHALLKRATVILDDENLEVEIEYEDVIVSQFPISGVEWNDNELAFVLFFKHTDCMAKDICIPSRSGEACDGPKCAC